MNDRNRLRKFLLSEIANKGDLSGKRYRGSREEICNSSKCFSSVFAILGWLLINGLNLCC